MRPALSIIVFTTLSGAGYGLLAWLGISMALLSLRGTVAPSLDAVQLVGLGLGLLLSTAGLVSSLGHLGKPKRAWRALTQWRSSWLSREAVLALATVAPALALAGVLLWAPEGPDRSAWLGSLGALLAVLALGTVASTAMVYASLKPIPAWRHPLVVPVYLLFSLLTGLGLLFVLMAWLLRGQGPVMMAVTLAVLGGLLAALKWLYWHEVARRPMPVDRGDAIGLPGRDPAVFERPHTEPSYITREMAFAVARRHALALRLGTTVALFFGPMMAVALLAAGAASPAAALLLAAVATLAAAFMERWLFFAEARHVVANYY
jgi:sulfite dehydrogenase (quinone) subunit SoeC